MSRSEKNSGPDKEPRHKKTIIWTKDRSKKKNKPKHKMSEQQNEHQFE